MTSSRAIRILKTWVEVVLVLGVAALLWPASLGGRVDYVMVSGTSMEPGLHNGDLVIVRDTDDYDIGDAVAYRIAEGEVGAGSIVVHRLIGGDGDTGYRTQGDNRDTADLWHPKGAEVVGERWMLVPGAGTVFARMRNPAALGIIAGVFTLLAVAIPPRRARTAAAA